MRLKNESFQLVKEKAVCHTSIMDINIRLKIKAVISFGDQTETFTIFGEDENLGVR